MKIKKKTMNKIHNEMVRRFSPYWDRKNVQMEELRADMASIMRQIEELKQLAEPKAVQEASKDDRVKYVATTTRGSELKGELWKAIFLHEGKDVSLTVTKEVCAQLSDLYVAFVTTGNLAGGTGTIRLTPSYYSKRDDLLAARVSQLMGINVKAHWVKLP